MTNLRCFCISPVDKFRGTIYCIQAYLVHSVKWQQEQVSITGSWQLKSLVASDIKKKPPHYSWNQYRQQQQ